MSYHDFLFVARDVFTPFLPPLVMSLTSTSKGRFEKKGYDLLQEDTESTVVPDDI